MSITKILGFCRKFDDRREAGGYTHACTRSHTVICESGTTTTTWAIVFSHPQNNNFLYKHVRGHYNHMLTKKQNKNCPAIFGFNREHATKTSNINSNNQDVHFICKMCLCLQKCQDKFGHVFYLPSVNFIRHHPHLCTRKKNLFVLIRYIEFLVTTTIVRLCWIDKRQIFSIRCAAAGLGKCGCLV